MLSRLSLGPRVLPSAAAVVSHPSHVCCRHQQKRSLRAGPVQAWRKALLYPPNTDPHEIHLHLPSLTQYQQEIEAVSNPVTLKDIGLSEDQYLASSGVTSQKESVPVPRSSRKGKKINQQPDVDVYISSLQPESLVQLVDQKIVKKELDYARLRTEWMRSAEGKRDTLQLAHHYHIYRDLFSSPSQVPVPDTVPKVRMPHYKPYPDRILHDLFRDWFPGSVRYKEPEPRMVYHFVPHVPVHAEFAVSERRIAEEEDRDAEKVGADSLVVSPVCRGNLITPLYASARPNVVIDARTGSGGNQQIDDALIQNNITLLTDREEGHYYTLALFNLDTTFGDDKPVCHWMVSNISSSNSGQEVMSFMPVYGIRGLGYHRYVFLLMRHEKEITVHPVSDFTFSERQLDPLSFLQSHAATPIGVSWFQSTWDSFSQQVLHKELDMRSPVYEYVQAEEVQHKQVKHPFAAPFNLYLDHYRDPKEISKQVLTERLKDLNPFDYSSQFEADPLPNAYGQIRDIEPTWMQSTEWKRRNRVGPFRGLRPASGRTDPDLEYAAWPPSRRHSILNVYPDNVRVKTPLRLTKWVLPPNEHPQYRIQHTDDLHHDNQKDASEKD